MVAAVGPGRAIALILALSSPALIAGCGAVPSCAGGTQPPEITVTVDPVAWTQAHPNAVVIVACASGSECRRIRGALLRRRSVEIGQASGSGQDRLVTVRFRADTRTGRVLLRRTLVEKPTVTQQKGPCGTYDVVTLPLVISPDGTVTTVSKP